jgi:3-oxoacyl-[acyl-carrier-protein] synthase III
MRYNNVRIESLDYTLPETVVTSLSLEERVAPIYQKMNLSYGRFEMMTGIRERRSPDDDTSPSQGSTKAAEKAIAKAGIDKADIECLLHTSVCRDFLEPATAYLVHDSLGLPATALVFDISNACMGFINGMVTLANMIELGQVKAGIVVGAEGGKRLIDKTIDELLNDPNITREKLKTSFASLTLGAGAVAMVMTHSSLSKSGHKLLGGTVRTASQHNGLCRIERDTYFHDPLSYPNMSTDYTGILSNGVALAAKTWKAFQREMGWSEPDVDWFFTHQVSTVHQQVLFHTLGLDKSKGFSTVEYLGNIGSCSLPISLAIGIEQGRVKAGDKLALMAAGSGLCTFALAVEW